MSGESHTRFGSNHQHAAEFLFFGQHREQGWGTRSDVFPKDSHLGRQQSKLLVTLLSAKMVGAVFAARGTKLDWRCGQQKKNASWISPGDKRSGGRGETADSIYCLFGPSGLTSGAIVPRSEGRGLGAGLASHQRLGHSIDCFLSSTRKHLAGSQTTIITTPTTDCSSQRKSKKSRPKLRSPLKSLAQLCLRRGICLSKKTATTTSTGVALVRISYL